jgi:hypothetical protein
MDFFLDYLRVYSYIFTHFFAKSVRFIANFDSFRLSRSSRGGFCG